MTHNSHPLALRGPAALALLEKNGTIDRRTRRQLEKQMYEMWRTAQEAAFAQAAASEVYYRTVATADATLAAADLLKAVHAPFPHHADLEALDSLRRTHYLKTMNQIAENANEKIIKRHNR